MAQILPGRPPEYRGKDPEVRRMQEYMQTLFLALDQCLAEMQKKIQELERK